MKIASTEIQQLGLTFWKESLLPINFPINITLLEQAILLTQPISIVKLDRLSLLKITKYLRERGVSINYTLDDKELFGFVLSYNGHAYIFLNGTESSQEQCFTLAHELSHYLIDYKLPREVIIKKYGESIIEALNNKRDFTTKERLLAIINGYTLKQFTYLLDAPAVSAFDRLNVWKAENKADELAMELLAPYKIILQDINRDSIPKKYFSLEQYLPQLLQSKYGLTVHIANLYGKSLAIKISGGISLAERWGI